MNAMLLKPYDQCWNAWHELYNKWMNFSTNVFQKMKSYILQYVEYLNWFIKMNILVKWIVFIIN